MRRAVAQVARGLRPLGNRGGAMVEFALAAMPFFLLLFGTLELGLMFVTNICLTNATQTMARQVRVGSTTLPGAAATTGTGTQMTLSAFKAALCNAVPIMSNASCLAQIQVDVRVQSSFAGSTTPNPVVSGNFDATTLCFYSGSPGNVVTMHAYMVWPIATPALLSMISNIRSMTTQSGTVTGSYLLLTSSEVFKNEPNPASTNTGSGC